MEWAPEEWLVTSPDDRDAVDLPTGGIGVDAAKRFVDDTDLSGQSLLIHQYNVEECRTRQLERLAWGTAAEDRPRGGLAVRLEYIVTKQDTNCQHDGRDDVEATLVRLPIRVERLDYFESSVR